MKYIIVGRAGCGRHDLAKSMAERGFTVAKGHTTRKPRYEGEDTHIFLTEEQAAAIPAEQKLCYTEINGKEFFYTREELEQANAIHCTAERLVELCSLFPDEVWHMVYIYVSDDMERKLYAAGIADNKIESDLSFNDRDMSEDASYSALEESIAHIGQPDATDPSALPAEIACVLHYYREYTDENTERYADYLATLTRRRGRLMGIIRECIELNTLDAKDGKVMVAIASESGDDTYSYKTVSIDHFADVLLSDNEGMAMLMQNYILASDRFKDLDPAFIKGPAPVDTPADTQPDQTTEL